MAPVQSVLAQRLVFGIGNAILSPTISFLGERQSVSRSVLFIVEIVLSALAASYFPN